MLLGAWTHVHTLNHVLSGARIPRPRTKEHFWGHLGMPRLVCGRYSQFYSLGGISEAVYGYQYCSKCNETVQSAFFHWRISASLPTLHTPPPPPAAAAAAVSGQWSVISARALFIPGIFWGIRPSPKKTYNPPNGCQIVYSIFLVRQLIKIYHGNFLLMDNKRRKLFALSNQKDADLCLKCTKIRLAAGLRPHPLGELVRSPRPRPPSRNRGCLLLRGGRENEGAHL